MSYDPHANFAYGAVLTAPSPATSGTSLVLASGQGALFPAAPFNCTVWPTAANPLSTNAEIVRVTAITGDTLTIVRAQEGSSARTIVAGDQVANTVTKKALTDIEAGATTAEADAQTAIAAAAAAQSTADSKGNVNGPASAAAGAVALFDGTTGALLKDGGLPSALLPATIHAATSKTTPVDADETSLVDSAASNVLKKLTWANLKATLKTYFDGLYPSGSGTSSGTNTGDQTSVSGNAGTATALQTARNIDGQAFNGGSNITVIAPGTHAASSKSTPVDADEIPLVDSAASNVLAKLTWTNLKATLKTYFDTLYGAALGYPILLGGGGGGNVTAGGTFYFGNNYAGTTTSISGRYKQYILVSGTIKRYTFQIQASGGDSGHSLTVDLWLNNATSIGSTTIRSDGGGAFPAQVTVTGLTQAVTAWNGSTGDYIEGRVVGPSGMTTVVLTLLTFTVLIQ